MKEQVATYLRLSLEDVDKRTNKIKDDSNSIVAQRLLINRHLDKNPMLCDLPRIEFCDDGFSGTNFDRPEFARMIEMAKRGEISCIVVKDLSRFGRDYLEVGDYLEHIFPFLGVRFKSINDHYDSAKHEGQTISMSIAFKNLIYDHYSKDLSKKVKSAMNIKQKECHYVNVPPYGYMVSPTDKHQLVIDDEAATVVRRIFMDVIGGKSCTQIARELNSEKVLTPSQYKGTKRPNTVLPIKKQQWTHSMIHTILKNLKYAGTMVNHTRESRHLQDKSQRRVPKDEWYVKENAHEAIVSQEEFDAAQDAIHRRRNPTRTPRNGADRVYYCAHCGSKLEKSNGTVFACPSHRYHDGTPCENVRCRKSELEDVVLAALKAQIEITRVNTAAANEIPKQEHDNLYLKLSALKAQIEACSRDKFSRYEDYREGRITQEEYLAAKDALAAKEINLKAQLQTFQSRYEGSQQETETISEQQNMISRMDGLSDEQLRTHLYDAIERIMVYDAENIEIIWKFNEISLDAEKNAGVSA